MTLSVAPYAAYEFEDNTLDSVANGPTLGVDAGSYVTGKVGAKCFNGTVNATGNTAFATAVLAGNWSICFWFKREVANNRHEFSFDNTVNKSTNFRVDRTGTGFYRMKTSNSSYIQDTTVAEDGNWHHAAFVFNGTQILYYMDGALQGTKTYSILGTFSGSAIAYLSNSASAGKGSDQWLIFTAAITADDVTAIYNGGSGETVINLIGTAPGTPALTYSGTNDRLEWGNTARASTYTVKCNGSTLASGITNLYYQPSAQASNLFTVEAINSYGTTASNELTVAIPAAPIPAYAHGAITWPAVTNAATYQVYDDTPTQLATGTHRSTGDAGFSLVLAVETYTVKASNFQGQSVGADVEVYAPGSIIDAENPSRGVWAVYEFNNDVVDSQGNGPDLSDGTPGYMTGLEGQAIGGSVSRSVVTLMPPQLKIGTVGMWVKLTAGNIADYGGGQVSVATASQAQSAYLSSTGYDVPGNVNISATGGAYVELTGKSAGWHHVAVTRAGTTETTIYFDGVEVYQANHAFGGSGSAIQVQSDGAYEELIDQAFIASYCMTPEEIAFLGTSYQGNNDWEIYTPPATGRSFVSKQCYLTA